MNSSFHKALRPVLLMILLLPLGTPATAAAEPSADYRIYIKKGTFRLDKPDGTPCKFYDLTRLPNGSHVVNSSFPTFEDSWAPDYNDSECGFFMRPNLSMKGRWSKTFVRPLPGEVLNDLLKVDFVLRLQIHDCSSGECKWVDDGDPVIARTYGDIVAGGDVVGESFCFTWNDLWQGDYTGELTLTVGTERVGP